MAANEAKQVEDNRDISAFEHVETEIKTTVFNVLYVLLKDEETVTWKLVLMAFCDFFQIF